MNTILFAMAGIAALIGISFLFTHFENLRNIRWKERMAKFRKLGTDHANFPATKISQKVHLSVFKANTSISEN